jgi:hypothetical protein
MQNPSHKFTFFALSVCFSLSSCLSLKMTTEKNEITEDLSKVDFTKFIDDYDEWICTVCQEGDSAFDGARIFHTCGNHEYHSECLAGLQARGNMRCPVCRCPPDAPVPPTQISEVIFGNDSQEDSQAVQFDILSQVIFGNDSEENSSVGGMTNLEYQRNPHRNRVPTVTPAISESLQMTDENCTYCRAAISRWGHHVLTDCRHRIHMSCALTNIRVNGVNINNGAIFCPRCLHAGTHQKYFE